MSERVTGYVLLVAGLLIMAFATISVFNLLNKDRQAYTSTSTSTSTSTAQGTGISNLTDLTNLAQQGGTASPLSALNLIPNLGGILGSAVTYFLMMFLLNVGYKIASMGITLLRPIEVKLRTKESFVEVEKSPAGKNPPPSTDQPGGRILT